jgi:hypothetical protein
LRVVPRFGKSIQISLVGRIVAPDLKLPSFVDFGKVVTRGDVATRTFSVLNCSEVEVELQLDLRPL